MPVTQRCNYAGTLGKPLPTRSLGASIVHIVGGALATALAGAFKARRRAR